jgi:predicted CXXCH cytochrome family protein
MLVLASFVVPSPIVAADPGSRSGHRPPVPWTNNHCGSCHAVDPLFSHPVNIVPSMPVPGQLPLHDGRMTCLTCHEDSAEAHGAARADRTPLLRQRLSAEELCLKCHDRSQPTRANQHGTMLGRAHLRWPEQKEPASTDGGLQLDADTRNCLSCHDGLMSSDIAMGSADVSQLAREHPIGMNLAARASDSALALRDPQVLDPRIRLVDGRVGCTSCHSPFSPQKKLLVMSNHRSQLCLSCHIQ